MAKVTAPLMSITAHGSLSRAMVFRRAPTGHTARAMTAFRLIPGHGAGINPTAAQRAQRATFSAALEAWRYLPQQTKSDITAAANDAALPVLAHWFRQFLALAQPFWIDILNPWDSGLITWED